MPEVRDLPEHLPEEGAEATVRRAGRGRSTNGSFRRSKLASRAFRSTFRGCRNEATDPSSSPSFAVAVWTVPAAAQHLGRFQDWRAHQFTEEGKRVCTIWTQPTKAEGDYTRRGEIFATVSHRPEENRLGIVSFEMGYPFASGQKLSVSVDGGGAVRLPASGSIVWDDSREANRKLVEEMREGLEMVAIGRSQRGTRTVDTYSLRGFTAAYGAISKACGVR